LDASCAHLQVVWRFTQIDKTGLTQGWWECKQCHTRFKPSTFVEELVTENEQLRAENVELNDLSGRDKAEIERLRVVIRDTIDYLDGKTRPESARPLTIIAHVRAILSLADFAERKTHGHVVSGQDEFGKFGRNEPEKP